MKCRYWQPYLFASSLIAASACFAGFPVDLEISVPARLQGAQVLAEQPGQAILVTEDANERGNIHLLDNLSASPTIKDRRRAFRFYQASATTDGSLWTGGYGDEFGNWFMQSTKISRSGLARFAGSSGSSMSDGSQVHLQLGNRIYAIVQNFIIDFRTNQRIRFFPCAAPAIAVQENCKEVFSRAAEAAQGGFWRARHVAQSATQWLVQLQRFSTRGAMLETIDLTRIAGNTSQRPPFVALLRSQNNQLRASISGESRIHLFNINDQADATVTASGYFDCAPCFANLKVTNNDWIWLKQNNSQLNVVRFALDAPQLVGIGPARQIYSTALPAQPVQYVERWETNSSGTVLLRYYPDSALPITKTAVLDTSGVLRINTSAWSAAGLGIRDQVFAGFLNSAQNPVGQWFNLAQQPISQEESISNERAAPHLLTTQDDSAGGVFVAAAFHNLPIDAIFQLKHIDANGSSTMVREIPGSRIDETLFTPNQAHFLARSHESPELKITSIDTQTGQSFSAAINTGCGHYSGLQTLANDSIVVSSSCESGARIDVIRNGQRATPILLPAQTTILQMLATTVANEELRILVSDQIAKRFRIYSLVSGQLIERFSLSLAGWAQLTGDGGLFDGHRRKFNKFGNLQVNYLSCGQGQVADDGLGNLWSIEFSSNVYKFCRTSADGAGFATGDIEAGSFNGLPSVFFENGDGFTYSGSELSRWVVRNNRIEKISRSISPTNVGITQISSERIWAVQTYYVDGVNDDGSLSSRSLLLKLESIAEDDLIFRNDFEPAQLKSR